MTPHDRRQYRRSQEISAGRRLAAALNRRQNSDFVASPGEDPDVWLESPSGRFCRTSVEVVRAPFDPTIHHENDNAERFQEALRAALNNRGVDALQASVELSNFALLLKSATHRGIADQLADLIARNAAALGTDARWIELELPAELRNSIDHVSIFRLPAGHMQAVVERGCMIPMEPEWILEAIHNKARKNGNRTPAAAILVIDGQFYIDEEQIHGYHLLRMKPQHPFSQVWVLTNEDAIRLE